MNGMLIQPTHDVMSIGLNTNGAGLLTFIRVDTMLEPSDQVTSFSCFVVKVVILACFEVNIYLIVFLGWSSNCDFNG